MQERSARRLDVVADPKAVSLIKAHGGRLYVYADAAGQKHVQTEAPNDSSIRFRQIEADGFVLNVDEGIKHPELWSVTLSRIPHHHLDVAWDGHPENPHLAQTVCIVKDHDWEVDPDSHETNPVLLCRRCGARRELVEVSVGPDGISGMPGRLIGGKPNLDSAPDEPSSNKRLIQATSVFGRIPRRKKLTAGLLLFLAFIVPAAWHDYAVLIVAGLIIAALAFYVRYLTRGGSG
jgi:hypothetical protein